MEDCFCFKSMPSSLFSMSRLMFEISSAQQHNGFSSRNLETFWMIRNIWGSPLKMFKKRTCYIFCPKSYHQFIKFFFFTKKLHFIITTYHYSSCIHLHTGLTVLWGNCVQVFLRSILQACAFPDTAPEIATS